MEITRCTPYTSGCVEVFSVLGERVRCMERGRAKGSAGKEEMESAG